ncbi:MAG: Integrase core domain protein [Candidatus Cloacimonetes bacterium ADurb.Bin003]|jgi:IS30 family transposase|nr:MAG: Integrase core domain protein [Candidatus Cloacimonetes bacterium ADurb.Bin003]
MNTLDYTPIKEKNKHLTPALYDYICSEYNHYISSKDKTMSRTEFMKLVASKINTCLSNLYKIIKAGMTTILTSNYEYREEFSGVKAYWNRQNYIPNNLKYNRVLPFLNLVVKRFNKTKGLESIETIVNDLKNNQPEKLVGLETVSVKTIYNYINRGLLPIKLIDLPIAVKRKKRTEKVEFKKTKGTSIELRPDFINNRTEFGHWEGDTVIGTKTKDNVILTLLERKTRKYIAIKIKDRTALSVCNAFDELEEIYGDKFKNIFKSITFDNGVEFSNFKYIEKRSDTSEKRTEVYFTHPYASWERGSNERHNRFLRFFIKKGKPISNYSQEFINKAVKVINSMSKKVLNYKNSDSLYNLELSKLQICLS